MVIQSIIPSVNMVQQWLVNLLAFLLHAAPSWEANLFSASQEIPRILLSPKVHYRIYKCPILSQINPVHAPHPTSWRFILILSSHLRLGLPSGLFPLGLHTKTLCTPILSPIRATCPTNFIFLDLITRIIFGVVYKTKSSSLCIFLHSPVTRPS